MNMVEVWVYRQTGQRTEFLLLHRQPAKGGFWQPVCGQVKNGENKLEAAYREVTEETSIPPGSIVRLHEEIHEFTMNKHYLTGEPVRTITETVYAVKITPKTAVRITDNPDQEHDAQRWCSYDEAMTLLKWQDNKDALKKLMKELNGHIS